jgi:hypothetical protein
VRGAVARGMVGELTEMASKHGLAGELLNYSNEEELDITAAAIEARPAGSRVRVWPAPINVIYVDQQLVRDAVAMACSARVSAVVPTVQKPRTILCFIFRSAESDLSIGCTKRGCSARVPPSLTAFSSTTARPNGWVPPRQASLTARCRINTSHSALYAYKLCEARERRSGSVSMEPAVTD